MRDSPAYRFLLSKVHWYLRMKLFGELAVMVTLVMFDSYVCQDKGN